MVDSEPGGALLNASPSIFHRKQSKVAPDHIASRRPSENAAVSMPSSRNNSISMPSMSMPYDNTGGHNSRRSSTEGYTAGGPHSNNMSYSRPASSGSDNSSVQSKQDLVRNQFFKCLQEADFNTPLSPVIVPAHTSIIRSNTYINVCRLVGDPPFILSACADNTIHIHDVYTGK